MGSTKSGHGSSEPSTLEFGCRRAQVNLTVRAEASSSNRVIREAYAILASRMEVSFVGNSYPFSWPAQAAM